MGTKNNPGKFDCYANAEPDEPMFVLLGRDCIGGAAVRLWAQVRRALGESSEKVQEALVCADAMDAWARSKGKEPMTINEIVELLSGDIMGRMMGVATQSPAPDDNVRELRPREVTREGIRAKRIDPWQGRLPDGLPYERVPPTEEQKKEAAMLRAAHRARSSAERLTAYALHIFTASGSMLPITFEPSGSGMVMRPDADIERHVAMAFKLAEAFAKEGDKYRDAADALMPDNFLDGID